MPSYPKCIVTVNGAPVAGLFFEKLIHIRIEDHEGGKADSLDMLLEDGPPAFLDIPRKDDLVEVWLGYLDGPLDYMGAFKVDDVEADCWPWKLSIKGKSADLREGLKQHRSRHWDNKSYGDVAKQMAQENGLEPQIDGEFGAFRPDADDGGNVWVGQNGESALHWLHTRAERHGCVLAIKKNKLIVAKRGSGQTAGGGDMIPIVVAPAGAGLDLGGTGVCHLLKNTCKVHWGQRERHEKVRAHHHNRKSGKREHQDHATGDRSAKAVHTMRHAMSGPKEAKAAAKARGEHLRASGLTTSCTIEGNPLVKGGAPMTYAGVRPQVDGLQFVIETATHTYSKGPSYRTEIKAKSKTGADPGDEGG